jgi:predicted extracellular nuclease
VEDASKYFDEPDVILLGDLNADCSYYDEDSIDPLRTGYEWLVPNNADTNVSDSTSCAYDRIIVTQEVLESLPEGQPRY